MGIYEPATYDIREAVPPLMARVRVAFVDALEERLAKFDLKVQDYLVLVSIAQDVAHTASSVCSVLSHDPGAMTRKLDALEKRGLLKRVRSPDDRRAIKLELTPEGKKIYPKVLAEAVGVANEFLHGFTKAEVRQMEDMLKRILHNAHALEEMKV